MKATGKFKIIMANMEREQLLNFIWVYDNYVDLVLHEMKSEEDWDVSPLNIEDFYHEVYKKDFKV